MTDSRGDIAIDSVLGAELELLHRDGLYRRLREVSSAQDGSVVLDGQPVMLFCSNNYLGLANHPEVVAAAREATLRYGASAASSRLVSGHMSIHSALESRIASWKRRESALLFSTGYHANVGVITALTGADDLIVSDELNHASIVDGARLSRAPTAIYRHNDVDDLLRILEQHSGKRRVLVVTEAVFSMDGDLAPLTDIALAAEKHGAWLMVDEAHSAGIFGPGGAGLVAELGLEAQVQVHMGTLGKALGSFGAYVAGSRALTTALINRARPFIFTTGLPPAAAAAAVAAIDLVEREPQRAAGLLARSASLGARLRRAGLRVPQTGSQILPVIVGGATDATDLARRLLDRGIYVAAIRPPTVPRGSSRLRISLMATHSSQQIAALHDALIDCANDGAADAADQS
ncbi:MAG: 8-amino-7-oxononanoate synthase [Candidatus Binatia bacterium]